jgi:hypothetical protein
MYMKMVDTVPAIVVGVVVVGMVETIVVVG